MEVILKDKSQLPAVGFIDWLDDSRRNINDVASKRATLR
jgi:hypothetical protein